MNTALCYQTRRGSASTRPGSTNDRPTCIRNRSAVRGWGDRRTPRSRSAGSAPTWCYLKSNALRAYPPHHPHGPTAAGSRHAGLPRPYPHAPDAMPTRGARFSLDNTTLARSGGLAKRPERSAYVVPTTPSQPNRGAVPYTNLSIKDL